jgi:hypothetical protein
MRGNQDRLVKDLYDRISSAEHSRDLPRLLDPALLDLARELAATFDQDAPDVATPSAPVAAGMIVAVYWSRYQLLPDGPGRLSVPPEMVRGADTGGAAPGPGTVRDYLATRPPPPVPPRARPAAVRP